MSITRKPRQLLNWGRSIAVGCILAISTMFSSVEAQTPKPGSALTVRSDVQEANSRTGVITARGNVQVNYPARKIQATAAQAQYFSRERRLVLSGNVYVLQDGNSMRAESITYSIDEGRFVATPPTSQQVESIYLVDEESEANSSAPRSLPKGPALKSQP
jgi:lipopolysaccharide export system protein LptA